MLSCVEPQNSAKIPPDLMNWVHLHSSVRVEVLTKVVCDEMLTADVPTETAAHHRYSAAENQ